MSSAPRKSKSQKTGKAKEESPRQEKTQAVQQVEPSAKCFRLAPIAETIYQAWDFSPETLEAKTLPSGQSVSASTIRALLSDEGASFGKFCLVCRLINHVCSERRTFWELCHEDDRDKLLLRDIKKTDVAEPESAGSSAGDDESSGGAPKWSGDIDVLIRRGSGWIGLEHPDALPIQAADGYKATVSLNRSGYGYVLLIKPDGSVKPIYPHLVLGDWKSRPSEEVPLSADKPFVFEPKTGQNPWWKIPTGGPGMLTLLLLAGESPLAPDAPLESFIGPIGPQSEESFRATLWFENGIPIRSRNNRDQDFVPLDCPDPMFDLQRRIRERLVGEGKPFSYSLAVAFATHGRQST
jgi:hypothetical protein